jgi:hypothetical protein
MLRDYFLQDAFIIALMVSLLLVVTAKQLYVTQFLDFLEINWNVRYQKLYAKDWKKSNVFHILLFLNLSIALSIFIHFSYSYFAAPLPIDFITILQLFLTVGLVISFKLSIEMVVARLFEINAFVRLYLFQKVTHLNFSGVAFLILNFFLLFSNFNKSLLIYLGLVVVLVINLTGFIRFLRLYQKTIIPNFFYFLLYLCALEIGPYFILYKAIKDYFG